MKKLILTATSSVISRLALSAFVVALIGNVLITHQAHATFFAPRGQTQIVSITGGTDRVTGQPLSDASPGSGTVYIYSGDTVGWKARVWNAGDLQGGTDVTVRNDPFVGPNTNTNIVKQNVWFDNQLQYEPFIIGCTAVPIGCGYYFLSDTKNYTWYPRAVRMDMAGSNTPGNRYCEYVSVNPAGINFIPGVGASSLIPGIPPWWPFVDARDSNFTSGAWVGPLGPAVPGDAEGCAEVAYNYNLVPTVTNVVRSGSTDTIATSSSNQVAPGTPPTSSQPSQWQITQVVLASGASVPAGYMSGADTQTPCNDKGNAGRYKPTGVILYCAPVGHSGKNATDPIGVTYNADGSWSSDSKGGASPNTLSASVAGIPGGKVCYVYSISSYKPVYGNAATPAFVSTPTWYNSAMFCPVTTTPPTHPKVQILGDDLRAGRQIITSAPAGVGTAFGSWAAYASYAGSLTNNFATAAGLAGGKPSGSFSPQAINALTFANTQATFGSFADATAILGNVSGIQGYFTGLTKASSSLPAGDVQNLNSLQGGATPYLVSGKLNILQASTIPKGKTIIIVANDTVTLNGDIMYANDTLNSSADIPQLVIVAPRITIGSAVHEIDAWLVTNLTTGTSNDTTTYYINTCTEGGVPPQNLTTGICNTPLIINGPVITSHLYLNRTSGDDTSDAPAETFANRGDAYLWALNYANSSLGWVTTKQTELPPRF